jgi:diguanylate cyclase (GGDEF)-like protein/PAS domain S-box-containing protein
MNFLNLTNLLLFSGLIILLVGVFILHRKSINQLKQNLATLQENEKTYRMLVTTIPSIIFKGYMDGTADFFDEAKRFETLTGYPVEEFSSHRMRWADIILPEDVPAAKQAFKEALKGDKHYMREYRIKAKFGAIRWIRERGHIIYDEQGQVEYVTGICTDFTLQQKVQAALRESEKNYRLLVQTIPSVVFKGYADWSVEFFDDKFEKMTGYLAEDFNSRKLKWSDLILPEDYEKTKETLKQALKSNRAYMREYRIRLKNGEIRWARERSQIFCDQHGQIEYISGVCTDITQEREMLISLEKMQHHNEMVLNSLGEGLIELDQTGEVLFVNPKTLKLLGYEGKDLMGQNLHELIHYKKADGSPYPEAECPIHATLKKGESNFITDDVFWTKKGEPLPVAFLTNSIVEDGQVTGAVITFRDITWRKRAEAELKRTSQYMENIFDNSAEAIGIVDRHGVVTKWNKACENTYGYSYQDLQGKPAFDLYADKDELAKMTIQLRRDGFVKNYEITKKRKDGSTFPCSLSIKVLRDENGKNVGSVTVARDLTELKEKEMKLQEANDQLQVLVNETNMRNRNMTLLQEMSDVFQSCQTSGETYSAIAHFVPKFFPDYGGALYILNNSKNLYEMTSIWGDASSMELVFGNDECWSLRRSRAYLVADSANTMNCRHVHSSLPGSYLCVPMMAQGEVIGIFHLRKAEVGSKEELQSVSQFASTVSEAMAMALANLKLRETLRNQAIRDGLTGLFNRRYLEETLERELSRGKRQGNPLGVIMLDLDHFKEYNDTYGHNAGDELLIALGQLIQDQVRREDIACRFGGEEFLLIMPGAPLEIALERANELNLTVKQLHKNSSSLKPISISAGVAIFPDHGGNGKDVIRAADAALYRAKEEGRDRVVVASSLSNMAALAN